MVRLVQRFEAEGYGRGSCAELGHGPPGWPHAVRFFIGIMLRTLRSAIVGLVAVAAACACSSSTPARAAATVDSEKILWARLDLHVAWTLQERRLFCAQPHSSCEPEGSVRCELERLTLERLIDAHLERVEARRLALGVTDAEVAHAPRLAPLAPPEVEHDLQSARVLRAKLIARVIKPRVRVTPADADEAYRSLLRQWPAVTQYRVITCRLRNAMDQEIRDLCRAQLDGLRQLMAAGDDFCLVASAYDGTAGKYCGVTPAEHLDPAFLAALDSTSAPETTPVTETADGIAIGQKIGGPVPSRPQLREQMMKAAEDVAVAREHRAWLRELRRKYTVTVERSRACRSP